MDWMLIVKAIVLGVVEGLTEFIPVSSTGHLIIASELIGFEQDAFGIMFNVVIQLAAILAVLILFWPRIWVKLRSFFKGEAEGRRFMAVWVIGCVPAAVAGVLFNDFIDEHLFSVLTVAIALILGALLLLVMERVFAPRARTREVEAITVRQAVGVGVFQCLSLWPGFSRSASTIMGGWAMGMDTHLAADYSFFLAIPIMFGASGYSMAKFFLKGSVDGQPMAMNGSQVVALIVGCVAAFVVAMIVVKAFMAFLKKHSMRGFAIYRLLVGILLLILVMTKVL